MMITSPNKPTKKSPQKLPIGLVICLSTLLSGVVVALQNAESYATKMESALYQLAGSAPALLRQVAATTHVGVLQSVEVSCVDGLARLFSTEGETAPPVEALAAADADEEESAEQGDGALAAAESEPAEDSEVTPVAEVAVVAEPEAVAETTAPQEEQVEEPGVMITCSTWWWAVSQVDKRALPRRAAVVMPFLFQRQVQPMKDEDEPTATPTAQAEQMATAQPIEPQTASSDEGVKPQAVEAPKPAEVETPRVAEAVKPLPEPAPLPKPAEVVQEPQTATPAVAEVEPTTEPAAAEGAETPPMRCRIMMVGDSLMEGFGALMYRDMMKRKGLEFVLSARFSTGLCQPEYFDWPQHMREVVSKTPPDFVIILIGANDGLGMRVGNRPLVYGSPEWEAEYSKRMDELVSIARGAGAEVIWIPLPTSSGRFTKLGTNQRVQRTYCQNHQVALCEPDLALSGAIGKYSTYGMYKGKQVRLRKPDMVHLTDQGNKKILEEVLKPMLEKRLMAFYKAHPERHLNEQQLQGIYNAPLTVTCRGVVTGKPATAARGRKRRAQTPAQQQQTQPQAQP